MPQPSWQVGQALLSVTVLALLLGLAIASDLRAHRIPNRLVGLGLAAALLLHAWALAADAVSLAGAHWWSPLAGAAVGAALLMPLHLSGGMGAGDVKLMAMAGAFVGARGAAWSALYALVLGGMACAAAALWSMACRRADLRVREHLQQLPVGTVGSQVPGNGTGSRRFARRQQTAAEPKLSLLQPPSDPAATVAVTPARSGFRRVPYAPVLTLGIVLAGWRSWSAAS